MIVIEVLMIVLSIFLLFYTLITMKSKKIYKVILFGLTVLTMTTHFVFGDMRWQLYPLYVALFLVIIMSVFMMNQALVKKSIRMSLVVVSVVLILTSILTVFSFPRYQIPKPNGDYLIGTENFVIEDQDRIEQYSEIEGSYRTYKIQVWYPAETVEGYEQAPWIDDGLMIARALATNNGLPYFALDHTVDIMSNSYYGAPISTEKEQYPIIVLSHGWSGFRNLHTDFAEELASLGYIVVAIDHTYGSVGTVLDGEVVYLNQNALPNRETTSDFIDYANQLVNTYAGDVIDTIDYLEVMNENEDVCKCSGALDLSRIGLLGHSTGGGADVRVALEDPRIDALIGLDAWVEPISQANIDLGLPIPALFLRSGTWETGENNAHLFDLIEQSSSSTLYQIDGTTHFDFAMVYMYSPLTKYIGFTGTIESSRLTVMLKSMITDFFNHELGNTDEAYIYPDVWEEVKKIEIP